MPIPGEEPMRTKGTLIELHASKKEDNDKGWKAVVSEHKGKEVEIQVTPSPEAIIGSYQV